MNSKKELDNLIKFMSQLIKREFYGKLTVSLEKGKIVHLRQEENIKLFD